MTFSLSGRAAGAVGLALALVAVAALAPMVAAAGPLDVSIVNQSFQPADLTVQAGDTVTWTVTQAIADPHSVTSGSPGADSGKVFDSTINLRNNGDKFTFTFANPGTYPFYCQVHPTTMTGTITVLGAGGSAPPPSATAATQPTTVPSAAPAGSEAPAGSGAPSASPKTEPPGSENPPIAASDKAIAAGILGAALLLLFGSAVLYRRVNR